MTTVIRFGAFVCVFDTRKESENFRKELKKLCDKYDPKRKDIFYTYEIE